MLLLTQRFILIVSIFLEIICFVSVKSQLFVEKYNLKSIFNHFEQIEEFNLNTLLNEYYTKAHTKRDVNNSLCFQNVGRYLHDFKKRETWALMMYDSSSKLPSSILKGNIFDFGNYDQCVSIDYRPVSNRFTESVEITGKYCLFNLWIDSLQNETLSREKRSSGVLHKVELEPLYFLWSFCLPHSCDMDHIVSVLGQTEQISCSMCLTKNANFVIENWQWVLILLLLIYAIFIGFCTWYDWRYQGVGDKMYNKALLAFSSLSNGRHLTKLNLLNQNNDVIACIHGFRVLSMIWVIYGHRFEKTLYLPHTNLLDFDKWMKSPHGMLFLGSTVVVDSFFVLSGLCLTYSLLKYLDKTGKINLLFLYLNRYLRLTPVIVGMILIQLTIVPFLGSGPMWNYTEEFLNSPCREHWWTTLLYIQNYVNPNPMCIPQAWYLAADMQMFWFSPFIIYPLWKYRKVGVYILIMGLIMAWSIVFAIVWINQWPAGISKGTPQIISNRELNSYFTTHTRFAPYLIGIGCGFILHRLRGQKLWISKKLNIVLWLFAIITTIAVVFGMFPFVQNDYEVIPLLDAIYLVFSRSLWAFAVGWMIIACNHDFGGAINSFLSSPLWQPVSRLSYCMFVVHFTIQAFMDAARKYVPTFSAAELLYRFWGDSVTTIIFSIPMYLMFEAPFVLIGKLIFEGNVQRKL